MQDENFSLNMVHKYVRSPYVCVGSAEPDSAKLDCSERDCVEPIQIDVCRQNREQTMTKADTVIFFGLCPSSDFLKKNCVLEVGSVSIFRQRST
jgi:hypothetical protein